jgi:hypothetical protein
MPILPAVSIPRLVINLAIDSQNENVHASGARRNHRRAAYPSDIIIILVKEVPGAIPIPISVEQVFAVHFLVVSDGKDTRVVFIKYTGSWDTEYVTTNINPFSL